MKKKLIIILLVILFIMLSVLIAIKILYKPSLSLNISNNRIKELYDNSYKYYLLYEGNVGNNTNTTITVDNMTYFLIDNNIKTFEDIETLINQTFISVRRDNLYNDVVSSRNLMMVDNAMYINYNESCDNIEFNYEDVSVNYIDDKTAIITNGSIEVYVYYEDDDWYLNVPLHFCNNEKEDD